MALPDGGDVRVSPLTWFANAWISATWAGSSPITPAAGPVAILFRILETLVRMWSWEIRMFSSKLGSESVPPAITLSSTFLPPIS